MTDGVEALARAALDRRLDRSSRAPLAVAVSGGGDSMALLHLAADWAREAGRPLHVLTVDHRLHPDSDAWARQVCAAAGRLDVPCDVLPWEGPKPATGLPAAARAARHALLAETARQAGARVLLMGHTADDLAESGRMRAAGSSVGDPREWAPSPAWPEGRGVFLLRPLLALSRDALRLYLRGLGERWVEDPANHDLRFSRARARAADGAPASAPRIRTLRSATGAQGLDWGGLLLPRSEAADIRCLSAALLCAGGGGTPPKGPRLQRLARSLEQGVGGALAGARAVAADGAVVLGREGGRAGPPSVKAEPGAELIWDGRFAITVHERGGVGPAAGRLAWLSGPERARLKAVPPFARPTLPLLETASGAVRLLSEARPLALERFRAACGVYANEADLTPL